MKKVMILVLVLSLFVSVASARPLFYDWEFRVNTDMVVGLGCVGTGIYGLTLASQAGYIAGGLLVVGGLSFIYGALKYEHD